MKDNAKSNVPRRIVACSIFLLSVGTWSFGQALPAMPGGAAAPGATAPPSAAVGATGTATLLIEEAARDLREEAQRQGKILFPPWVMALRRYEIIAIGSFPIMLFYTNIGLDLSRWITNGFGSEYAPWPFKNEFSYKPTDDEKSASLATAAAFSLVLGAVDCILHEVRHRKEIGVTGAP